MTEPLELPSGAVVTLAPPVVPGVEAAPPVPSSLAFLPSPGPRGQQGAAGTNTRITGEIPSGALNGINTIFTTTSPFLAGTTSVYLNGIRENLGEGYSEAGPNTIAFSEAPLNFDTIVVDYLVSV